jgi:hypothetical protein
MNQLQRSYFLVLRVKNDGCRSPQWDQCHSFVSQINPNPSINQSKSIKDFDFKLYYTFLATPTMSELLCDVCDDSDGQTRHVATVRCEQCNVRYCDECVRQFHPSKGALKLHTLLSIKSLLCDVCDDASENHFQSLFFPPKTRKNNVVFACFFCVLLCGCQLGSKLSLCANSAACTIATNVRYVMTIEMHTCHHSRQKQCTPQRTRLYF